MLDLLSWPDLSWHNSKVHFRNITQLICCISNSISRVFPNVFLKGFLYFQLTCPDKTVRFISETAPNSSNNYLPWHFMDLNLNFRKMSLKIQHKFWLYHPVILIWTGINFIRSFQTLVFQVVNLNSRPGREHFPKTIWDSVRRNGRESF